MTTAAVIARRSYHRAEGAATSGGQPHPPRRSPKRTPWVQPRFAILNRHDPRTLREGRRALRALRRGVAAALPVDPRPRRRRGAGVRRLLAPGLGRPAPGRP